jgi:hypothetical protein
MNHAREAVFHVFRDLAQIFGRSGALTLVLFVSVVFLLALCVVALMFYLLLKFGEVTFQGTIHFIKEIFKLIWYHPRQASPAIRLELYFDAAFLLMALLCLATMAAHALIPWIAERNARDFAYAFISALVLFALFAYQSLRIAGRLPIPAPREAQAPPT